MAHDGSGQGWDETAPANSDPGLAGAQEIRDLRKGMRLRLEKEHETPTTQTAGGEHKKGSGKSYYQTATPTLRPDATTALSTGTTDDGRLWLKQDTLVLYSWTGGSWVQVKADVPAGSIATADIANDAVDKDKIAADVAGTGLVQMTQTTTGALMIVVDDSTIEFSTATTPQIQVKDAGITAAKLASGLGGGQLIVLYHEETSGSSGGTVTASTWNVVPLNLEAVDEPAVCSLSANVFTLDAGTYRIYATHSLYTIDRCSFRLYNVTDAGVQQDTGGNDIYGVISQASVSGGAVEAEMFSVFTIAGTKALRLEMNANTSKSSNGFGYPSSLSVERYGMVILEKMR